MKKNRILLWGFILFMVGYAIASSLFSDWDNFKRGINGEPEIHVSIE